MSSTHVLVVYTSPAEGKEAEYNTWYNEVHLIDVLKVPGFVSARRFKLPDVESKGPQYLALYEMEAQDPKVVMAALGKLAGTPAMVISDALDSGSSVATIATAITGVVML